MYEREFGPLLAAWVATGAGTVADFWKTTPADVAAALRADPYGPGVHDRPVTGDRGTQREILRRRMRAHAAQRGESRDDRPPAGTMGVRPAPTA